MVILGLMMRVMMGIVMEVMVLIVGVREGWPPCRIELMRTVMMLIVRLREATLC